MGILRFLGLSPKTDEGKTSQCHFPDGTDWHSHLLPGVDDGFQETEKSLAMLRNYEAAGVRDLWLTPHIMEDVPNETSHLREVFEQFKSDYDRDWQQRGAADAAPAPAKIRLHLAAENMLDALFEKRLKANDLLPLGEKGDHLLVETSIFSAPMNFRGLLERIKNKGYTPVLAHPERYLYMEKSDYEKLKAQGIKFQRNLFSLKGQYGDTVKKRCKKLMKWGMYDYVGSDLHREGVFWRFW